MWPKVTVLGVSSFFELFSVISSFWWVKNIFSFVPLVFLARYMLNEPEFLSKKRAQNVKFSHFLALFEDESTWILWQTFFVLVANILIKQMKPNSSISLSKFWSSSLRQKKRLPSRVKKLSSTSLLMRTLSQLQFHLII